MPAMTLGLAEVEERVQALRRRLNGVTALHAVAVSVSTAALVFAGLILLGLRGSAPAFRIAAWGGVGVFGAVVVASWVHARRQWLDLGATARLVDQRGALTDRLATLMDLRARPRAARLAPMLVAQTLALGERWRLQRIAPRRVPRSLYLVPLSLLALSASPLMAPPPPASAPAVATLSASQGGAAAAQASQTQAAGARAGTDRDAADDGTSTLGGSMLLPGESAPPAADLEPRDPPHSDSLLGVFPDRLRHAILGAFHAEQMDRPEQLAARSGDGRGARGKDQPGDRADRVGHESAAREHDTLTSKKKEGEGQQPQPGKLSKDGHPIAPSQGAPPDKHLSGSSPSAGTGSSPSGLMAGKDGEIAVGQDGAPTFKLTITSFLRAIEHKSQQPRPDGKRAGAPGEAPGAAADRVALNERQLKDDALRKAEIPAEYEDIVERVYSMRDEP